MIVSELIARLQTLPQDLPVVLRHEADCCCGECFLPHDRFSDPDPTVEEPSTCCGGSGTQSVVL